MEDYAPALDANSSTARMEKNGLRDHGLSGEAAELYTAIQAAIARLSGRVLSVENQHVVARTVEQAQQVVEVNRELVDLGEDVAVYQGGLVAVLTQLRDEVQAVVAVEVEGRRRDLAEIVDYARSRESQSRSEASVLQLAKQFNLDPLDLL